MVRNFVIRAYIYQERTEHRPASSRGMDKSTAQNKNKRAKQNIARACEIPVKSKQYISLPFSNFP